MARDDTQPNIMDPLYNGMPNSEAYRGMIFPDLFPNQKVMVIENWDPEDVEMYCTGGT